MTTEYEKIVHAILALTTEFEANKNNFTIEQLRKIVSVCRDIEMYGIELRQFTERTLGMILTRATG